MCCCSRSKRLNPRILRGRGHSQRMVGPAARPPDQHPVLLIHPGLPQEDRHARKSRRSPSQARPQLLRRKSRSICPAIPWPQGRRLQKAISKKPLSNNSKPSCWNSAAISVFIARQRRLRIGDEWYRVDLLFFHRKLRASGGDRPEARQIHSCRCRANVPLPQLRPRASGGTKA